MIDAKNRITPIVVRLGSWYVSCISPALNRWLDTGFCWLAGRSGVSDWDIWEQVR